MSKVYIIDVLRSPICKTNGALSHTRPEEILKQLINEMINRNDIKDRTEHRASASNIDDVIIAHAVGLGGNIARLATLSSNLPMSTTATTIDFQCGGSLKSLEYGYYSIKSGHKSAVIVGGVESTSLEPRVMLNKRDPQYHGEVNELRGQFSPNSVGDPDMLEGAENCYQLLKPSKESISHVVLESHRKALMATDSGKLIAFICPIDLGVKGVVDKDEGIRGNMSMRLINRAKPIVCEDGFTTVANSCLKHDGGSLMLLVDEAYLLKNNVKPIAEIIDCVSMGIHPKYSPLGAVAATKTIIRRNTIDNDEIEAIEVNEAFAIKTWAMRKYVGVDPECVNPLGGALAFGHPYGATGGILMAHLLVSLKEGSKAYGIVTMGVAGGQGISVLVKKYE